MAPLKVIIVGAGIGGLAAAICLARNGHQVTVYERLSSTTEVGYAFRITANSDRCLKFLRNRYHRQWSFRYQLYGHV